MYFISVYFTFILFRKLFNKTHSCLLEVGYNTKTREIFMVICLFALHEFEISTICWCSYFICMQKYAKKIAIEIYNLLTAGGTTSNMHCLLKKVEILRMCNYFLQNVTKTAPKRCVIIKLTSELLYSQTHHLRQLVF